MGARRFVSFALVLVSCGLGACGGGSSNAAPEVSFDNLLAPVMAMLGGTVPINYTDDDPDSDATTTLYADRDGDLLTTGDQVVIAMDRPEMNGTPQSVSWDTTGVTPGIYRIFAVTTDTNTIVAVEAPGRITVNNVLAFAPANAAALRGTASNLRVTFLFPILGGTLTSATMPVRMGAVLVPGTYAIENGIDATFVPDSCVFLAPASVTVDVMTTIGVTTTAPTVLGSATFTTAVSPVWAVGLESVSEVNAVTETETDDFPLDTDDDPWFVVSSQAGMLYMSNRGNNAGDGDIIVFNTLTGTIASRIPLVESNPDLLTIPAGLRLSADESKLYVAVFEADKFGNNFTVADAYFVVVDVASGMETSRIPLSASGRLRSLVLSPDGLRAYVAGYDAFVIHVIDLLAGAEVDTDGDIGNGVTPIATSEDYPSGLALDGTGTTLYASFGDTADVLSYSTATFAEGTRLDNTTTTGIGTPDLTRDPCDGMLYLPIVDYDPDLDDGLTVFDPAGPTATGVTTDADEVYNRGFAFVWGTDLAAIGNHDTGEVLILDKTDLAAGTALVTTSNGSVSGLATIPPMRN